MDTEVYIPPGGGPPEYRPLPVPAPDPSLMDYEGRPRYTFMPENMAVDLHDGMDPLPVADRFESIDVADALENGMEFEVVRNGKVHRVDLSPQEIKDGLENGYGVHRVEELSQLSEVLGPQLQADFGDESRQVRIAGADPLVGASIKATSGGTNWVELINERLAGEMEHVNPTGGETRFYVLKDNPSIWEAISVGWVRKKQEGSGLSAYSDRGLEKELVWYSLDHSRSSGERKAFVSSMNPTGRTTGAAVKTTMSIIGTGLNAAEYLVDDARLVVLRTVETGRVTYRVFERCRCEPGARWSDWQYKEREKPKPIWRCCLPEL